MAVCDACGNDGDRMFTVSVTAGTFTFDSFQCAIDCLAPICTYCGCRIIGRGVEEAGSHYCGSHCARRGGVEMTAGQTPGPRSSVAGPGGPAG